jgi:transketolase
VRAAFSQTLVDIARADPRVVLLTGDHGYALFDDYRRVCPDQYINAGIAEQNMVGVAAGMARAGFRPYVYGLAAFVPIRVLEQIKIDLAHDSLPVVLIGDGAGMVYSHLGTSHQSTEDIAVTRVLANLQVYSPADRHELTRCLELSAQASTPIYLRIGKADRGDVHAGPVSANVGDLLPVRQGTADLVFLATGSMVRTAIDIADQSFPQASVWSAPFIKPIDATRLLGIARQAQTIVCMEEHSIHAGFGSWVCELVAEHAPTRVLRIGVQDRYSLHCGTYDYLLQEHGLDAQAVTERIRQFMKRDK